MRYVGPRGIPLSVFLSWDALDQDAALSWQSFEARRCPSCGTHPDEVETHPEWRQCSGCVASEQLAASVADPPPKGLRMMTVSGPAHACEHCNPKRG